MIPVELETRGYDVVVGTGILSQAATLLAGRARAAVVSQAAVAEAWAGLGEVAKYAFMGDPHLIATLEAPDAVTALTAREAPVLEDVVARCAAIKAGVVAADEHERTGLRATLNYGHTLAHALETAGG